jgi:phage shock protein PspC (stress-responsive transcriptional regulator)
MIGGVCGGLAHYFAVDPSLIRLVFVLLFVFGGSGFLLYVILWIILPEEGRTYASPEEATRANTQEIAERAKQLGQDVKTAFSSSSPSAVESTPRASGAWIVGLVMIALGGLFLLRNLVPAFPSFWAWWPIVLILIGAVMLYNQFRR